MSLLHLIWYEFYYEPLYEQWIKQRPLVITSRGLYPQVRCVPGADTPVESNRSNFLCIKYNNL